MQSLDYSRWYSTPVLNLAALLVATVLYELVSTLHHYPVGGWGEIVGVQKRPSWFPRPFSLH